MAISKVMQERYGPDSVAFVVDEGFTGISFEYGSTVATFGMAEKGSVNVNIKVETLGGHSSVPPAHTGSTWLHAVDHTIVTLLPSCRRSSLTEPVGIMSLVLAELEANPFPPSLTPEAPFLKYLTCLSDNAPEFPKGLRKRVQDPKAWPKLAEGLQQLPRNHAGYRPDRRWSQGQRAARGCQG
jgi:Gly-Xaa carboxypeptidase